MRKMTIMVAAAMLFVGTSLFAECDKKGESCDCKGKKCEKKAGGQMCTVLNLTDEQKKKIKVIRDEYRKQIKKIAEMRKNCGKGECKGEGEKCKGCDGEKGGCEDCDK